MGSQAGRSAAVCLPPPPDAARLAPLDYICFLHIRSRHIVELLNQDVLTILPFNFVLTFCTSVFVIF